MTETLTAPSVQPRFDFTLLTPILKVADVDRAVAFYRDAFGFKMLHRFGSDEGPTVFAVMAYGNNGRFAIARDENSEPTAATTLYLYCDDCVALSEQAVRHGATLTEAAAARPWGDTTSYLTDPFGFSWELATPAAD